MIQFHPFTHEDYRNYQPRGRAEIARIGNSLLDGESLPLEIVIDEDGILFSYYDAADGNPENQATIEFYLACGRQYAKLNVTILEKNLLGSTGMTSKKFEELSYTKSIN